ncbi:MAG: hypothetical protein C5B54_09135 [Acidobacteria bacterium]|nr:MAG: hypothetical protein C5B54_09135 [Acidobacteriota bacterium]
MAKIRAKLRELRDADVRYISLVDRAATRIPFRVLKRNNEETAMGIDLSRVFKQDQPKPTVIDVVVFAQPDQTLTDQVRQSIATVGFTTDRVRKADEETLVYPQQAAPNGSEPVLIRLSDQMVVSVTNLTPPADGLFANFVESEGFYPGFSLATKIFHDEWLDRVQKAEQPGDTKKLLDQYHSYVEQLLTVPEACFKADGIVNALVAEAVQKAETETPDADESEDDDQAVVEKRGKKPAEGSPEEEAEESEEEEAAEDVAKDKAMGKRDTVEKRGKKKAPKTPAEPDEDIDDLAEDAATEEPTRTKRPVADEDLDDIDDDAVSEDGKRSRVDALKTDGGRTRKTQKCDDQTQVILAAIEKVDQKLSKRIGEVTTKVETVVQTQSAHQKALDGVVKKTETLENKLGSTVVAGAPPSDRPAERTVASVKKYDDDPRTGCFDTAFLRRVR